MGIYKWFETFLKNIRAKLWYWFIWIHEMKNIHKKRHLYKNVKLTKEQKQQIDDLWKKNYGKKIPYWWHRLYQSYTGKFDVNYFPEHIFASKLEPWYVDMDYGKVLSDKNLLDVIFKDDCVKIPKTFLQVCGGVWSDENKMLISREQAITILKNIGEVVLKITVESGSGRGVKLCDFENGIDKRSQCSVESILSEMGNNLVVQERLVANEDYARLHKNSVNTIRVVSYILDGEIYTGPLAMRIGAGDSFVDNAHAGGMFVGVSDDGYLNEEAYTEYQKRFKKHPDSGVVFKGYKVPYTRDIINAAKRLHSKIPMLKFISWDFMIDSDNNVTLIETNIVSQTIWFPQMGNGVAFFGDNTDKMIRLARKRNKV